MGLFLVLEVQRKPGDYPKLPGFHTLGDGGLTTLYQLYICLRYIYLLDIASC